MSVIITGGIFFALLSEIRYRDKRSNRINTEQYGSDKSCDNTSLLIMLGSLIGSDFQNQIANKTASAYRTCEGQGGLNLNTDKCKKVFQDGMTNHYDILLTRMNAILQQCIVNDKEHRLLFSRKILWLLSISTSLDRAIFYYNKNTYSKQDFLNIKNYDFPKMVLSIWNALIVNCQNNKGGRDTFLEFFIKDNSIVEFVFNKKYLTQLPTDIDITNWQSPEETIKWEDYQDKQKEPQPEEAEAQEDDTTEVVEVFERIDETSKNINQRVINIHDKGKYFEHVETLIIKDDD